MAFPLHSFSGLFSFPIQRGIARRRTVLVVEDEVRQALTRSRSEGSIDAGGGCSGNHFAEKLLASQRKFAEEVVKATAPLRAGKEQASATGAK